MMGLGTLANVLAILAGGGLGLLLKGGLPERWQRTMGLAVVFIGAAGAMPGLLRAEGGALAGTGVKDTLGMIFALALGTLVGEWIDLDDKMERLGAWLKAKADRGGDSQFVQGFVTVSLTVCIGAMAVVGSIQDGLSHDPSTLLTKAVTVSSSWSSRRPTARVPCSPPCPWECFRAASLYWPDCWPRCSARRWWTTCPFGVHPHLLRGGQPGL